MTKIKLIQKYFSLFLLMCLLPAAALLVPETLNAAGTYQLPPYEKVVLKNGLTLYLMEQHEVPIIRMSMVIPVGAIADGNNYGLASLTAAALKFGTKSHTKTEIEEELDYLGAGLFVGTDTEHTSIAVSCLKKDLDKVLPILQEVVTTPRFDETEFTKHKKRTLMNLDLAKESPRQVIGDYTTRFIYGDHPYGNPVDGTKSTVAQIEAKDLKAFYELHYHPANSAIAVVGDFKATEMKKKIENTLGTWKTSGPKSVEPETQSLSFAESRVLLVNKEDAKETQFQIVAPGITRANKDKVAIDVINIILGGRFSSWLNDELRVNAGLTYGARSRFQALKKSGIFYVTSFTATKNTVAALDLAVQVLNRLHEKGVDAKTLLSAKNYAKGTFPIRYETPGQLANLLTSMFIYDYDEAYINDFKQTVDNMTEEKAKEIIAKYFPKDKLQFVLIGKASEIRDKVNKYGTIIEKEIKTEGF